MVYTERDELLRPGRVQTSRTKWIALIGSVAVASVVCFLLVINLTNQSAFSSDAQVLKASAPTQERNLIPANDGKAFENFLGRRENWRNFPGRGNKRNFPDSEENWKNFPGRGKNERNFPGSKGNERNFPGSKGNERNFPGREENWTNFPGRAENKRNFPTEEENGGNRRDFPIGGNGRNFPGWENGEIFHAEDNWMDAFAGGKWRNVLNRENRTSRPPTVATPLGKVKGVNLRSRAGRDYKGFYNLPYAQPPVGQLRFKPPVPAKPWKGTRDCTVQGSMCVQKSRYNPDVAVEGTEDCLHVNLFTPKLPRRGQRSRSNPRMPVIVYFFGGAFMHGTANDFNCDYFMDEDVVMVIVESRVGVLGFLNTGDEHARGNMGLKDQNMALRWVQENIESFGGDPTRVVAFGTSSGAMCAHGHLLSPMSKGLFSGVMSFSGTTLSPGQFTVDPTASALEFGAAMNCTDPNSDVVMECLRNASYWDIALHQPEVGPTLELIPEDGDTSQVFFPATPIDLLLSGQANPVPWLTGVNSAETILDSYTLLLNENMTKLLNEEWDSVLPIMLLLSDSNQTLVDETTHQIHDFYFQNKTISRYEDTRFNLTNMLSDRYHYHSTRTAGLNHAKNNPVYWYYLTKEANVSFADSVTQYFEPPYGVSHADEVQYFFFRPRYPYIPLDSPWADFSILLVKLWVSFAATGAPVNPDPNGVQWPPVDGNGTGMVWYNLDDVPKLVEPFTDRMLLWDSFDFDMLYNNYDQNF